MKASQYIYFFLLFLFWINSAQNQQIKFNLVEGIGEISLGKINGITQDAEGYMWFADRDRNCITRYDGYQMISFRNDTLNPNSLGGTYPEAIIADPAGYIWIGLWGKGLDRYDPKTGIFTHFRHKKEDPDSLNNDTVTALLIDRQGVLWVGNYGGLDRFDQKTGKFQHHTHKVHDSTSLSSTRVRSVYEDRQGTIWVGTGFPWDDTNDGGLNRFDRKTRTFTRYLHDPKNPQTLINNKVSAIFEDSYGTFWIGTVGDGLHTLDRTTGLFTRHIFDASRPEQLSRPPIRKGNIYDHITFITEDSTGALWIGTFDAGITRYDLLTRRTTRYGQLVKNSGLTDNSAWRIYSSREGVLWISMNEANLYRIDPLRNIPHFAVGGVVQAFHEHSSGSLWFGTTQGLFKMDSNKKFTGHFTFDSLDQKTSRGFSQFVIREDMNTNLWMACDNRLLTFNPKNGNFVHYKKESTTSDSLANILVTTILEDSQGSLWIGGSPGLYLLDRQSGSLTSIKYTNDPTPPYNVNNNRVIALIEDTLGDIWIATRYQGNIYRLRLKTGKAEHYTAGDICCIRCMYEDKNGTIWVGTTNGLYRYNNDSGVFSLFSVPGHAINSAEIKAFLEDDEKNLWMSSRSGIFKLNPQRTEILTFGKNQGLNTNGLSDAACRLKSGELLFGDATGYYAFFPDQFTKNKKPPQIVISDFRITNQLSKSGTGTILKGSLGQTKQIQLNHNQNTFSFEFAGIHYSNPEENTHLYMLESHEDSWRNAGTELKANYFNLPPGSYVFRVKARSTDGIWAEKAIAVIITPPWWHTWWFRLIAIICLTTLFYGLIRWRLHQKFQLQLEHFKKENQLVELKQKTTELEMKALRAQMNPHFIFNSLNSITVFMMENNKEKAVEYLTKFSRLVRLILQNSLSPLITLESELEALRLYLALEALRFDHHFEYEIAVAEDVNISVLKVPPLIIQPYAENAIWHGLMQKEEKGKLQIRLFRHENTLCCKIIDDGIGRKNAAELESKSASTHKSLGMRITADRIEMLQLKNHVHAFIRVNDIVLPDGTAGGTEVLLKIPLLYD